MSLRKRQSEFAARVPALINKAIELGFDVTLGDAYRYPDCPYGAINSKHKERLAIDLNLFINGEYIEDDRGHAELGAWWESQGGTWGGAWSIKDYNHYQAAAGEWENSIQTIDTISVPVVCSGIVEIPLASLSTN